MHKAYTKQKKSTLPSRKADQPPQESNLLLKKITNNCSQEARRLHQGLKHTEVAISCILNHLWLASVRDGMEMHLGLLDTLWLVTKLETKGTSWNWWVTAQQCVTVACLKVYLSVHWVNRKQKGCWLRTPFNGEKQGMLFCCCAGRERKWQDSFHWTSNRVPCFEDATTADCDSPPLCGKWPFPYYCAILMNKRQVPDFFCSQGK